MILAEKTLSLLRVDNSLIGIVSLQARRTPPLPSLSLRKTL